jgi:hypothetical protein
VCGISGREEGNKRGHWEVKRFKAYYICKYEDSMMKRIKHCLKKRGKRDRLKEYNGGDEFIQSTRYASMKFSQCNSLVRLVINF